MKLNGKPSDSFMEFNRMLREETNMPFVLTIKHGDAQREFSVRLVPFADIFRRRLGLELQSLTPALVEQLGLERLGGVESGLFVAGVEKESPGSRRRACTNTASSTEFPGCG